MDALAGLYRTDGDGGNSRVWADRAAAGWARRLAMLPEAAVGHALEHELVLGSPAKALDLARRNFAARPYGDALVMLGWAQLANGQPEAAARTMTGLEASGWRTAQQYVVLSEALALLGRSDASQAARSTALAINPRSFDPATSLLWFGNH
jgi:predicted Zn-dependent protease